jgi:hypothetical protein
MNLGEALKTAVIVLVVLYVVNHVTFLKSLVG